MASNERRSTSAELFPNIPCDVCSLSGRHGEAKQICFDCEQALCGTCLDDHDKFGVTEGKCHRVVDLYSTVVGLTTGETCNDDGEEMVDMLVDIDDRPSDGIDHVPTMNTGTNTTKEHTSTLRDMQRVLTDLQRTKEKRKCDRNRLANEKRRSERHVMDSVGRIINRTNHLKDESLRQIQQQYDIFNKTIDDDIQKIDDVISIMHEDMKVLKSPAFDNDTRLFDVLSLSKDDMKQGANLNSKMGTHMFREAMHFTADHQIKVNMLKMKSLGELETPFCSSHSLGQYKIRDMSDTMECSITDACEMPDGTILLTDCNNDKLKRLDSSYNVVDHCKLPWLPESICRTGLTEVAVTLGLVQTVQFVSVDTTLTPTRSFHVGERCRGIAYSRGQLFITFGGVIELNEGPGEVRVYSIDGKLLHNLPQASTGQPFWTCPLKVAISPNGRKVIVSNLDRGLVTMNRDGSNAIQNQLRADNLCIQERALWFACRARHNKIFQFSDDGSNLGALLTEKDGIDEKPQAVCYQRNTQRLVVGFRDSSFIKVFQLYRN